MISGGEKHINTDQTPWCKTSDETIDLYFKNGTETICNVLWTEIALFFEDAEGGDVYRCVIVIYGGDVV